MLYDTHSEGQNDNIKNICWFNCNVFVADIKPVVRGHGKKYRGSIPPHILT